jgi:hypothetical protein
VADAPGDDVRRFNNGMPFRRQHANAAQGAPMVINGRDRVPEALIARLALVSFFGRLFRFLLLNLR